MFVVFIPSHFHVKPKAHLFFVRICLRQLWFYFIWSPLLQELTADPGSGADDPFYIVRTNLSTPKNVPKVDSGWSYDTIFGNLANKGELFEVMLDRILTPRGVQGVEFDNYFIRVDWSKHPIDTAFPFYKPKCLLGGLTSSYQLKIYDGSERQQNVDLLSNQIVLERGGAQMDAEDSDDEKEEEVMTNSVDEWVPVLDISTEYHRILKAKWEKDKFKFEDYKRRLYQVAIVDFGWIQPWDAADDRSSNLVTFHASGDIVFWSIRIYDDYRVTPEILCTSNLTQDGIPCRHKFYQLSSQLGVLAVGYTNGVVKICQVQRDPEDSNKISLGSSLSLWEEEDKVAAEFIEFTDRRQSGKVLMLSLIIIKHPNIMISFNIRFEPGGGLSYEEVSMLESPDGHVVGFCSEGETTRFVLYHENAIVSYVRLEEGVINYESDVGVIMEPALEEKEEPDHGDYVDSQKIHSIQDPLYASLWTYYGFGLSPNGVLGCSLKALRYPHDPIILKEAASCTFVSLFPHANAWDTVKEAYESRGKKIQNVVDCLHGLRYQLRLDCDYDFGKYVDFSKLNSMSISELKLYIWLLRAMGLPKSWTVSKSLSVDDIEQISLDVLRATTLAQERLVEQYLTEVIVQVSASDNKKILSDPINATSWNCILKYLKSKPNPSEAIRTLREVPRQKKLMCSSCDEEIGYEFNQAFNPSTKITSPGIPGYRWNGQTCVNQHKNPVCILSLLPLDYPHRLCPNCGCAALIKPAFAQPPNCPFCEEYMKFDPEKSAQVL